MPEVQSPLINLNPKLFKVRLTKYIPVTPNPKQYAFLLLKDTRELFYGGAGRGGKSISLLMGALQYVDQPGYNALLLRTSTTQLLMPGGLLNIALQWLTPFKEVIYKGDEKAFYFPTGIDKEGKKLPDAILKFGYLENNKDLSNYHSAEFHYVGFDEVTDFTEYQYTYMFTRQTKKAGCNIPIRMRSAANPVGPGFEWVKRRFIAERKPDVMFIPARVQDNPHVDKEEYIKSLSNVDPITREKILNGDWSVREESVMFKLPWFKFLEEEPKGIYDKTRVWDLAGTREEDGNDPDYTSGTLGGRLFNGLDCVFDIVRFKGSPKDVEDTVRNTAIRDGRNVEICIEEEPGSAGKSLIDHYVRNVLKGWKVTSIPPSGSKVARANPLASAIERGQVVFCKGALKPDVLDEFLVFPLGKHDDSVDSTAHWYNYQSQKPKPVDSSLIYSEVYKPQKKIINYGIPSNNDEDEDDE